MIDLSPAGAIAKRLVDELGLEGAHREVDGFFAQEAIVDQAAHECDWSIWARPKQTAPEGNSWQSWGFLAARMFGKTFAMSKYINGEAEAGRAMLIGLAAQDEDNAVKLQVLGPSGLIATAPPWFKPEWEASKLELVWPNGARAMVRTPEVPGKIRGFDYHLAWLSELQSWPVATRDEAWSNFQFAIRLGYARTVWDATPKKRHPILRKLLSDAAADPDRYIVVRGQSRENEWNVGDGVIDRLEREYGGTQKGREELLGEMLEDSDNALVRSEWIENSRRLLPDRLVRRVIGVDPAVTNRAGNDKTGIVEDGLGADGQLYVLGDYSGKHAPGAWAAIVLDKYVANGCDLVVVETNKGGDLVTQNLRASAGTKGLRIVVIAKEERVPPRVIGTVYVREVHARGEKADRAQPLATAYERGRISHPIGLDLRALEDTLTTWEPQVGQRSPDALDAHVHASTELLGLAANRPDASVGFKGIVEISRTLALATPARGPSRSVATLLGGGGGGGRL